MEPPRIRIGNQTAWSAPALMAPFEYAVAIGFDAFEWFPDKKNGRLGWNSADLSAAARADIRNTAQAKGVRLSVHADGAAHPLDPAAFPILLRDLELAEALGARLLNLHLYAEAGVNAYAGSVVPLLHRAAAGGLQVAIENTPETTPQHFNELFAAWQAMDLPAAVRVGMCFDLGHANLCPATRNDYLKYFGQLAPHVPVIHLHVHENRGDADTHLPLFTGPAGADPRGIEEFLRRLRLRRYSGSVILEQWPRPPSLLNAARDRLLQMWQAVNQPTDACFVVDSIFKSGGVPGR
jgi:sugar phosphate isomerase/epimerase